MFVSTTGRWLRRCDAGGLFAHLPPRGSPTAELLASCLPARGRGWAQVARVVADAAPARLCRRRLKYLSVSPGCAADPLRAITAAVSA